MEWCRAFPTALPFLLLEVLLPWTVNFPLQLDCTYMEVPYTVALHTGGGGVDSV